MLDVHAPHEAIHGFRDFLLHLLTITIGLLIALGLEGCVEWAHHRHLRVEADTNLRQEIRDNEKDLAKVTASSQKERDNLIGILKFLQARRNNKPYDIQGLTLSFTLSTLSDASWRTASATGALSLMDYSHVQYYSTAYQLQEKYSSLQSQTLDGFLQLQSYVVFGFDPDKITPTEAEDASRDVQRTLAHLVAMEEIGSSLGNAMKRPWPRSDPGPLKPPSA